MESPITLRSSAGDSPISSPFGSMGESPTFVKGHASLRQLYSKLRLAGALIFKSYTMRQIIRSADPVNYRKSITEISTILSEDKICDMALEDLFHHLSMKLNDDAFDNQIEGLISYLTLTVEAYLKRRKNIFKILGKNEDDKQLVQDFNDGYFEQNLGDEPSSP